MTYQEAMAVPTRAKLRVKDFLLLEEAGAFEGYARAELLDGEVWVVNATHRPHARAHAVLSFELQLVLRSLEVPLDPYVTPATKLNETSLPEPDIVIAERGDDKLMSGRSVRLAVEIADTSRAIDMGLKARLYAAAGIPEYWVLNVEQRVIHQMWRPDGEVYAERRDVPVLSGITAATIPGLTLPGFSID